MKELLAGLLVKDPGVRLGCRGRGWVGHPTKDMHQVHQHVQYLWKHVCTRYTWNIIHHHRSEEIKELPYFAILNWDDVLDKKLTPPLVPPRGEVNAQDAFDIGSFDDDDTKSIKVRLWLFVLHTVNNVLYSSTHVHVHSFLLPSNRTPIVERCGNLNIISQSYISTP